MNRVRPYLLAIGLLLALAGAIGGYQYLRFAKLAAMDDVELIHMLKQRLVPLNNT